MQQVRICEENIKFFGNHVTIKKGLKVSRNLKNVFNGMEKLRTIHYSTLDSQLGEISLESDKALRDLT